MNIHANTDINCSVKHFFVDHFHLTMTGLWSPHRRHMPAFATNDSTHVISYIGSI